jgi:hypothetical protein
MQTPRRITSAGWAAAPKPIAAAPQPKLAGLFAKPGTSGHETPPTRNAALVLSPQCAAGPVAWLLLGESSGFDEPDDAARVTAPGQQRNRQVSAAIAWSAERWDALSRSRACAPAPVGATQIAVATTASTANTRAIVAAPSPNRREPDISYLPPELTTRGFPTRGAA